MPELPEVETLARGIRKFVVGKTITDVLVFEKKQFRPTKRQWRKGVIGGQVSGVRRRAKWLVIDLANEWSLIVHLKMTGQLIYQSADSPTFLGGHTMSREEKGFPNSHTRITFLFTDGSTLFFQDMRKFGYIDLLPTPDVEQYFLNKRLGPEPMEAAFTLEYFRAVLKRRGGTTIKAVLLDQSALAGLGNIYADDACWIAGVRPMRRVKTLTSSQQEALHAAASEVLKEAISLGGTSFSDYYQLDGKTGQYWDKRKVYGRTGEQCLRCEGIIKKTRTAGRGTHYCPNCQK